jgi:hypothetical protein
LRTALVKQVLDVFGSWAGVKWKDTSPQKLFDVWPGKAVYWELTCMLQADWYIVPQASHGDYTRVAVDTFPGRAEVLRKHTRNVTPVGSIPFDEYDLVISFDAILKVPQNHPAVFAYFAQEHWDRLYTQSLHHPVNGYDLFLAHMMDSNSTINSLPSSISFPYVHDANLFRSIFPVAKRDAVWVEWRTLMSLAMKDSADPWCSEAEAAADRLQDLLELPIRYRGTPHRQTYGFADPPAWGDAAIYLQALAECKYFVSVGCRIGGGQGLAEAASAGCICIGQEDRAYHKLLCHPSCLCADIAEMYKRLRAVQLDSSLQQEVLAWQDRQLLEHFHDRPLEALQRAIEIKRKGSRFRTTNHL